MPEPGSGRRAGAGGGEFAAMTSRAAELARYPIANPARTLLAAALALACAYALASLWLPFGWDHGMMAATGEVLAHGGVPYRDSWDVKGPLAFVPIAAAYLIAGNAMWGVRLIELLILVPALIVLYRTVSAHTSHVIGAATSIGLYLWIASATWFFTGQADVWAMAVATVAVCLLLPRDAESTANGTRFLFVGLLIGCCCVIKPVFLALVLAPLAYLACLDGRTIRQRVLLAAWLAAGIAVPIVCVFLYFLVNGGLAGLIEVQFAFNLGSYQNVGPAKRDLVLTFKDYLAKSPLTVLLPVAVAGAWARRTDRIIVAPVLAWLFASVLALVVQGKLYAHHWFALFPPLLVLAAFGLHALAQEPWGGRLGKIVGGMTAAVFAFLVVSEPAREVVRWARHITGTLPDEYYNLYAFHTYNVGDEIRAAQYIRTHSAPSDGVFVWGNDATVRFLAGRPNPTRFEYDLPLTTPGDFYASYRAEMMHALETNPPAYIVIGSTWHGGPKDEYISGFPEFKSLLKERYVLEKTFGNVDLFHRVDHATREVAPAG